MVNKSGLMCLALAAGLGWHYPAGAQNAGAAWVTAWGASQQGLGATKITNATVRMIARVTIRGTASRFVSTTRSGSDRSYSAGPASGHAFAAPRSPPRWKFHGALPEAVPWHQPTSASHLSRSAFPRLMPASGPLPPSPSCGRLRKVLSDKLPSPPNGAPRANLTHTCRSSLYRRPHGCR